MFKNKNKIQLFIIFMKNLVPVLIASSLIGVVVSLPIIFYYEYPLLPNLCRSIITSLIIGFCAMFSFDILFRNINTNAKRAFVSVFIVILCGTMFGALVGKEWSLYPILIMVGSAELFGMSFCTYMYKKTRRLNTLLTQKQNKLKISS